jgi:excisionase family DNA binding protein
MLHSVQPAGYTLQEAAAVLGVSTNTIRARIRRGELRAERVHRPQGHVWQVFLPAAPSKGAAYQPAEQPATASNGSAQASTLQPAVQPADAIIRLVQEATAPLVAALERSQDERQHLAAALALAQERIRALEAASTLQNAPQRESDARPAGSVQEPATPRHRPWWQFWRP